MKDDSDIPKTFTGKYYDKDYFQIPEGKKYHGSDGEIHGWSYNNPDGEWLGAEPIAKAWKEVFDPRNLLDVGAGRGTFIAYARDAGIEAEGFDYSNWAVGDEGRYPRCKPEWLRLHDATEPWIYEDDSFDLLVALDFFEHIYEEDLDFVINEMFRVAEKYILLEIATVGGGSGAKIHETGYIMRKGESIPEDLEGCAVAGHVTVCSEQWWLDRLEHEDWLLRRDMEMHFIGLIPEAVISNWVQNSIIILERFD